VGDGRTGEVGAFLRAVAENLPRDYVPYADLGSFPPTLELERALEEFREVLRLDPNDVANYINLASPTQTFNRLDEAEAVYKQAEERKLESEFLLQSRYGWRL